MSSERITAFAPLRVPAYRRIWTAFSISGVGTFIQLTAGPWLMHELTGSPLMVSLVTTALFGPRLMLSLPAGALADVLDRRMVIVVGQAFSALGAASMAIFTAMGLLTPWLLVGLTLAIGVGSAVSTPSFMSLVPELVPRPLMPQAITLNSAAANLAKAIGPSIGGALVAVGLTHAAFGANAVSFLAVIGVVLTFGRDQPSAGPRRHLWRSTRVGLRYVRFTRSIRVLVIFTAIFNIAAAALQALLPSFASVELQVGPAGFGVLFALLGIGAVVGAATRHSASDLIGRHMLPISITTYGLAVAATGLTRNPLIAGVLITIAGVLWVWTATTFNSSVQVQAPKWVRGRVVSIYILAQGSQPIGSFLAGVIAEGVGSGVALVIMASVAVLLGLAGFRLHLPVLGDLREPEPAPPRQQPLSVTHAVEVGGSPIVVVNTFTVEPGQIAAFLEVTVALREQRLRTGATRWSLFRDAANPAVITEMFEVPDWPEHLAQHARLDAEAISIIRKARSFDVSGAPRSRHLAGLDPFHRHGQALERQLVTVRMEAHDALHELDGSVPVDREIPLERTEDTTVRDDA